MKKLIVFNKWFLIFIAIVVVTLSCVIFYIQTKHFSQFLTQNIKNALYNKSLQTAEFERIQLGIFPPSFKLINVELGFSQNNQDINAVFDEVGLDFSISGVFDNKVAITKLMIERGSIAVRSEDGQKTSDKINIPTLKEIVETIKKRIPIRFSSVGIYKTDINFKESFIGYIDQIELYRGLDDIELNVQASEFIYRELPEVKLNQVRTRVEVTEDEVKISNFQGVIDNQKMTISGKIIKPFQQSKRKTDLKVSGKLDVSFLNKFKRIEKVGHFDSGIISYSGIINNKLDKNLYSSFTVEINNLNCDYVIADKVKAQIELKNKSLVIREASIKQADGTISLERPFELYSLSKKSFVDDVVDVNAQDFPLNSALRYLHPTLKPLQGNINGPVSFALFDSRHFEFKAGSSARVQDIRLVYNNENILKFDWLEIDGMLFVYKNKKFYIEGEAMGPNSLVQVNGEISKGKILFQMPHARIELEDLGGIAGFDLKGNGVFDIEISNNTEGNIILNVEGTSDNTFFEGNELSKIDIGIEYNFNRYELFFREIFGEIDEYDYEFNGNIKLKSKKFDLTFRTDDLGFTSLRKLARELVFKDLPINLDFISGRIAGEVKVGGVFGDLRIDGNIPDADFWVAGEYFSDVQTKFTKRGDILNVFESYAKAAGGKISVSGDYLLDKSVYNDFVIQLEKAEASRLSFLDDPRLKFSSFVDGELILFSKNREQEGALNLKFSDTRTLNRNFSDSIIKASLKKEELIVEGEFLESFFIDSVIKFNQEDSILSFKSKTQQLGDLFTFLGVDPNLVSLEGDIDFDLFSKFKLKNWKNMNVKANLHSFNLQKDGFFLNSLNKDPILSIEKGVIKKGLLNIDGNKSQIKIEAKGDLNDKYFITNKGKLNAKLFEFFRDYWISSSGEINWDIALSGSPQKISHRMNINSSDWQVGFVDLPISPEKIEISIVEEDQEITIEKLNLLTTNGSIETKGDIAFNSLFPDINLSTSINNVRASLARDSFALIKGGLSFTGNEFPFLVQGNIDILKGLIGQGLIDKMSSDDESSSLPTQYLPIQKVSGDFDLIEMGIKIQSIEPVVLKNNWANIPLNILLRLEGSEIAPLIDGRIYANPREGRFVLKDQNYVIKKAEINFSGATDYKNPLIDLEAESNISNYLVNSRVVGTAKNYSVVLNSSPPLESSDILSLVTFGYTQNTTQDVGEANRENLTSVGVGSLLLDQLKIKSLLKDSFGLTLAVTSKEQEINTGFLNSRNGGDSIVDGRTQTTTRLQISKKLSKEFDILMSRDLSSDYQGLNLNYKIKPGVTARGIIEQQNNLEIVEGRNNATAVGLDVGFKWTFE